MVEVATGCVEGASAELMMDQNPAIFDRDAYDQFDSESAGGQNAEHFVG